MIARKEGCLVPWDDSSALDVVSNKRLAVRDAAAMIIGLRPCLCPLIVQNAQSRPSRNLQHLSKWARALNRFAIFGAVWLVLFWLWKICGWGT